MSTEDPTLVHIGIDFGTSNSVAYVCKKNRYECVPFQQGAQMPSLVILDNTKFVVGVPPPKFDSVVFKSVKKLLGQSYYDVDRNDDMSTYGCKIVEGPDDMCWYKTEERLYSCDEIAVAIFKKIKEEVDKFTDGKVGRTVVSVPARYSAKQRYHIQKAAEAAGFDVTNLINGPTAASVCVSKERFINGNILVFDLGAGTTDVTILNLQDTIYRVESSCGDDHLGGDDFDNATQIKWVIKPLPQNKTKAHEIYRIYNHGDTCPFPEWQVEFERGTRFRITDIRKGNGYDIIHIEELP